MQEHENKNSNAVNQDHHKYSNDPTPLELSMNELFGEMMLGSVDELTECFDQMFIHAIMDKLTLHMESKLSIEQQAKDDFYVCLQFHTYMSRVIRDMYITFTAPFV